MKLKTIPLLIISVLLSACATNFGRHLDVSVKNKELSVLGSASKFKILDSDSSSKKIDYNYSKIFGAYSSYTKQKVDVSDMTTGLLIAKRLESIGISQEKGVKDDGVLMIRYGEIMGWDMGDIVKQMTICGSLSSNTGALLGECVEFSEMKFVNTHPTRDLVVDNLLAILLTNKWPSEASPEKYRKFKAD